MLGVERQRLFDSQVRSRGAERQPSRSRITPDSFVSDGNSRAAHEFAREWVDAQQDGVLTALIACSDARIVYNPKHTVGIRTIGAAVPTELYGNVLSSDFGTKNVVVMAHHDGRKVEAGQRPSGCGGRDEKAKMRDVVGDSPSEGALRFVNEHVPHEDPIIGAWHSALAIAEQAQLPVLAVTQDHMSGKIIPIGAVEPTHNGGINYYSEISLRKLLHGQYDPARIYELGIPELPDHKVPAEFLPFMKRHARYLDALRETNPDLETTQAIQNPDTVLVTTVVRPSRGRLPELSGRSANRVFAITVARQAGETASDVDEYSIVKAADELQYPLANGLNSQGDPDKPFSSLHGNGTVVVETRNIARSRRVVEDLSQRPWFDQWSSVEGNKIIVAQTTRGIVDHAEYFKPTLH